MKTGHEFLPFFSCITKYQCTLINIRTTNHFTTGTYLDLVGGFREILYGSGSFYEDEDEEVEGFIFVVLLFLCILFRVL